MVIHIDLSRQATSSMASPEFNIMKLIELEQTLISGVNDKGTPITETAAAKDLTKVLKTLGRPQDKLRLIGIFLMCYGLPDADFKALQKMVPKREEQTYLKLIREFSIQKYGGDFKKPTRVAPQISPEDFKDYTTKYKEINEMYDILRCVPEIEKIA